MNETLDEESRKALVAYRKEQAELTLADAELLLNNDRLNSAANRIYYACFYAAEALLIKNAIRAATHAGAFDTKSVTAVENVNDNHNHNKVIRNGVLLIERNGVYYNAQGAVVE